MWRVLADDFKPGNEFSRFVGFILAPVAQKDAQA
jgi:hypothetical protein